MFYIGIPWIIWRHELGCLKKQNKTDLVQCLFICSNVYSWSIYFEQGLGVAQAGQGRAGFKGLKIYWVAVLLRQIDE